MDKKLPLVDKETEDSIFKEMERVGGDAFAKDLLIRLRMENPNIAAAIVSLAALSNDDRATSICAAIVYRLLEKQLARDGTKKEGEMLH